MTVVIDPGGLAPEHAVFDCRQDTRILRSLSYATLEQIVAASVQGILLLETHGQVARIRYANRAYERLSGYSARELAGNAWSAHFAEDSVGTGHATLQRLVARAGTASCRLSCLRKDGSVWCSDVHVSSVGGTGTDGLILAQHVVDRDALAGGGIAAVAEADPAPADETPIARRGPSAMRPGAFGARLLTIEQFMALLGRDLAIARHHDRTVTVLLFEIAEYAVYRQTFGQFAADACARMVAAQILGVFGRAIDLRAQLDESSFVVAVHEQPARQSQRLARRVAEKTARLRLPNPKGRYARHVVLASTVVEADPEHEDATAVIERARRTRDNARPSVSAVASDAAG